MKILLLSDLHGVIPEVKEKDFDFVIAAGDYSNTIGLRDYVFKNWEKIVQGAELHEIVPKEELKMMNERRYKSMVNCLNWLDSLGKKVFLIYGNGDITKKQNKHEAYQVGNIEDEVKRRKNLELLKASVTELENIQLIGLSGYVTISKRFDKKSLSKLKGQLTKMFKKIDPNKTTIFLTHDVPFGKFDEVRGEGPLKGQRIGDKLLLEYIEKFQPDFHICGHMHENCGRDNIGKTTVINPGDAKSNRYAVLEIKEDKSFNVTFY